MQISAVQVSTFSCQNAVCTRTSSSSGGSASTGQASGSTTTDEVESAGSATTSDAAAATAGAATSAASSNSESDDDYDEKDLNKDGTVTATEEMLWSLQHAAEALAEQLTDGAQQAASSSNDSTTNDAADPSDPSAVSDAGSTAYDKTSGSRAGLGANLNLEA